MPDAADYTAVTELPGRKAGLDAFNVIARRYAFVRQYVQGNRVLEVGCGPGLGLGCLAPGAKIVVGGEINQQSLLIARQTYAGRPGIALARMDAHALPFRDRSFDVVAALAMIYYLTLETFLKECGRVLEPGGLLIFCTPNKQMPGFRGSAHAIAYYSPPQLASALAGAGFELSMFGAFPMGPTREQWRRRALAFGGELLAKVGFVPVLPGVLKGLVGAAIRYERVTLPPEVNDEHLERSLSVPVVPVEIQADAVPYRVLYGVARNVGGRE